jgi:hypothetical protein
VFLMICTQANLNISFRTSEKIDDKTLFCSENFVKKVRACLKKLIMVCLLGFDEAIFYYHINSGMVGC